jgi:hypothetical protein
MQEAFIRDGMSEGIISAPAGTFFLKNLCGRGSAGGIPLADGAGGWAEKVEIRELDVASIEPEDLTALSTDQLEKIEEVTRLIAGTGLKITIG